ncbi:MAG: type II toxin-antitoxin system HicB family antitoxin [Betaproteobacteria bacterium]
MSHHAIIIFWSDDDQAFVADVPELPGCMAHGGTHEAALAAVKEAISLWLETAQVVGKAVPPARDTRLLFA